MRDVECGAALAVTLVLLAGLGTLALTAAAAAIAALSLAGHQQSAQQAFEAAEAGVAHALVFVTRTRSDGAIDARPYPDDAAAPAVFEARVSRAAMPGPLPSGFSAGEHAGAFATQPFFIVADGRAERGASARIEQGLYLVVPGGAP